MAGAPLKISMKMWDPECGHDLDLTAPLLHAASCTCSSHIQSSKVHTCREVLFGADIVMPLLSAANAVAAADLEHTVSNPAASDLSLKFKTSSNSNFGIEEIEMLTYL
jgi:hypothetical protein